MKLTRFWTLGCSLLLAFTSLASAQQFLPLQADGAGDAFSLVPIGGGGGFVPSTSPSDLRSQGTVGGRGTTALGTVEIGFDYIRPFWTSRDFTLAVPAANAANFPLLGNVGHVDDHFALAPRLNYRYDFSDVLAVKASGTFMSLSGRLERNATDPNGTAGNLTANSTLTLVTANLPEISTRFYYDELFGKSRHLNWSMFNDLTIDLGIGTRYSSITQDYSGKLSNTVAGGNNETQRNSHQDFKGVGLTTSLNFELPMSNEWTLFTNLRGSILVGDNTKNSALSVVIQGTPGSAVSLNQTKTEFIPIGEVEMGAEWTHEFSDVTRTATPSALFTVRMGVSAQVWGNVGPLSAGSAQGYSTSNLYLAGAHIMVGLAR